MVRRAVLIDALHVDRSATSLEDLTAIPREWLHYAQMCDGSTPPRPTNPSSSARPAKTLRLRTGGIALVDIWSTLPAGLPVSVELPNEPLRRAVGTDAWLDRLVAATRRHSPRFGPSAVNAAPMQIKQIDAVTASSHSPGTGYEDQEHAGASSTLWKPRFFTERWQISCGKPIKPPSRYGPSPTNTRICPSRTLMRSNP